MMWLLEMMAIESYKDDIYTEILKYGDEFTTLEPFWYLKDEDLCLNEEPIIALCSIGGAMKIPQIGAYPGVYCNFKELKVNRYAQQIHKYLLNKDYVCMPLWKLEQSVDFIFSTFGEDGCVFIRPDSGAKSFNGMILDKRTFGGDLDDILHVSPDINELICISRPQNIHREWRLVIADKKIVAYSQYKKHGKTNLLDECPNYIQKFAENVINSIDNPPDLCYTMDIAKTSDGPSVIELNSFSCSGLYKCNIPDVIKAVREVVIKDYKYYSECPF